MHFQDLLSHHNPSWKAFADEMERSGTKPRTNPDGDVDTSSIQGVRFDEFVVPDCEACLAENVRNNVVSEAYQMDIPFVLQTDPPAPSR